MYILLLVFFILFYDVENIRYLYNGLDKTEEKDVYDFYEIENDIRIRCAQIHTKKLIQNRRSRSKRKSILAENK